MAKAFVTTMKRDDIRVSSPPDARTVMEALPLWIVHHNSPHSRQALGDDSSREMAWTLAYASALIGRDDFPRAAHGSRRKSCFRIGVGALTRRIAYRPDIAIRTWRRIGRRRINPDNRTIGIV